jgi:hypothetical protein
MSRYAELKRLGVSAKAEPGDAENWPCVSILRKDGFHEAVLVLKEADESHKAFVLSTWINSYRSMARKLGWGRFYDSHEPRRAEDMFSGGAVRVLTDPSDEYVVYGWVCCIGKSLFHVYVAPELRRIGVANAMIQLVAGEDDVVLAKPWPFPTRRQVNPYLLGNL